MNLSNAVIQACSNENRQKTLHPIFSDGTPEYNKNIPFFRTSEDMMNMEGHKKIKNRHTEC